jgi:glycosyltransferase involved in cell wall biosynthesis
MRVALVSHNARAGDAIGNQVAEKLAFFLDRGADVRVLVESDRCLHPAVRPHCRVLAGPECNGPGWRFLSSADLVIVEYGQYYRLLELLPLLAGGKGRVLFDYHGVTPPALWASHNREAVEAGNRHRGLVWCADAAVAHSTFTCRELEAATAFPAERLSCLAHGVNREHFRPGRPGQTLAGLLGLHDVSLLLFVGRLAPNKRVPVLIEALARLRELTPAVHAVVIGDDGDLYQIEARCCRDRAAELGVADRLHWLGRLDDDPLRDAYRSADILVMPSRHEGFCLPVLEAMACGLPVVAARAAALPETVADAGLTFHPDDADDLARQVRRVLASRIEEKARSEERAASSEQRAATKKRPTADFLFPSLLAPRSSIRLAVVAFRYGTDFVGGAETSLRRIAETLHQDGHQVEVFTTCTREESEWSNQLPEGKVVIGGIPVHHFRLDPHDGERHRESVRAILQGEGAVTPEVEQAYLVDSIHSSRLIDALWSRREDFDAIIAGPYLFGLTLDVARAFPEQTLLLPCFHDEPFARLPAWTRSYGSVGGILYHSPEEQAFAQTRLGINHPSATCIGALVDTENEGNPEAGRELANTDRPYIVYCGRFSAQKELPALLDWAQKYLAQHPERFTFVFIGQGEVAIPKHPAFRDLGFVDDAAKRDLLAGAAALVQLSRYESLSYAALEAWAQGTPVLAGARCEVLAGHLRRCGGGRAAGSFADFARALDDLAQKPEEWQALGRQGQEYVKERYGSRPGFSRNLREAIHGLTIPLAARIRTRGLQRAAQLDRARWRERFAELVENLLDAGPRPYRGEVEVKPRSETRTARAGSGTVLIPVRVINRGSHAVLADGPGRTVLRCRVHDEAGQPCGASAPATLLPGLLVPGRALAAAVPVPVPALPGTYRVGFWAERATNAGAENPEAWLTLTVEDNGPIPDQRCCAPLLETVQGALVEAGRVRQLPDDYLDVTEGLLAGWKRRIKRKLLGNFKHAYVDVLSRQQSAFNQHVLTALQELTECCATLDHAGRPGIGVRSPESGVREEQGLDGLMDLVADLVCQLAESRQRCADLEERLTRLEEMVVASQRTETNILTSDP